MSPDAALGKILYIDDDPHLLQLAELCLRSLGGVAVETLADSRAALDRARAFQPDLILLDLVMPGCDGLEVLATLRADPDFADTPVIFLTGKTEPLEAVEDPAVLGKLSKPFEPLALPNEVKRLWRRKP